MTLVMLTTSQSARISCRGSNRTPPNVDIVPCGAFAERWIGGHQERECACVSHTAQLRRRRSRARAGGGDILAEACQRRGAVDPQVLHTTAVGAKAVGSPRDNGGDAATYAGSHSADSRMMGRPKIMWTIDCPFNTMSTQTYTRQYSETPLPGPTGGRLSFVGVGHSLSSSFERIDANFIHFHRFKISVV